VSSSSRRQFLVRSSGVLAGAAAATAAGRPLVAAASSAPSGRLDLPVQDGSDTLTISKVVRPGDVRYPAMIRGANQRFAGSPQRIVIPATASGVADAVESALADKERIGVRSGGHCYENFVANPDVRVLIDMSAMNAVHIDAEHKALSVGAGASLLNVYQTLYKEFGRVVPAGSCPSVGVGGFVANGGYGPLSRKLGLTVDHLYGVEMVVVDASGRARTVLVKRQDKGLEADLWWSQTGGGGGSFGIATRYLFRSPDSSAEPLPRPPAEVLIRTVAWPWANLDEARFSRLVRNFGRWHEENSAPGAPGCELFAQLKLLTPSAGVVALSVQVNSTAKDPQTLLDGFVQAVSEGVGAPSGAPVMRRPWLHALQWDGFSPANPTVMRFKIKSAHMRTGFPATQVAALYRNLTAKDNTNETNIVLVSSYGGQINAVAPTATATAARDSIMELQYIALWEDEANDESNISWVRKTYADVYAETGGVPVRNDVTGGCYIGYPDADLGNRDWNTSSSSWSDLYFGGNYARLQKTKAAWDPTNTFFHAQSIRLPG